MDNLLVVALLVVSCIVVNPFISAQEKAPVSTEQVAAAGDQNGSDDQDSDDEDEEEEGEGEEESSN